MAKRETKTRKKSAGTRAVSKKSSTSTRVRKTTPKQARQKAKKEARSHGPLPGSFRLTWQSLVFIKKFWKPLGGIVLVYALLNLIFTSGLLNGAGSAVNGGGKLADALNVYGTLISSGGSNAAPLMQTVLLIIESLVIIWALRHLFSGEKIGVKQAYYHSTFPLIPFVIVLFIILLQLLPLTIGSTVLTLILSTVSGSSAVDVVAALLFIVLSAWSLYMVSSSIFALYIVTLPDMHPRVALKSAKSLVRYRRLPLIRKILFLPLFIIVFMGIVIVPLILFANFLVSPAFFVLSMLAVLFAHTYLYSLYKGLLT